MTGPFRLTSAAFQNGGEIPTRFTCEGEDHSPPLFWENTPSGTRSLALFVEDLDAPDPDSPQKIWVHWVLYNISPETLNLPEGLDPLPDSISIGLNDWGDLSYGGPCPPIGRHRYFFNLYALDTTLPNLSEPAKGQVETAMKGHVLAQATLMGTYQKKEIDLRSIQNVLRSESSPKP